MKKMMCMSTAIVAAAAGSVNAAFSYTFNEQSMVAYSSAYYAGTGAFVDQESDFPTIDATQQTLNFAHNLDVSANPFIHSVTNAGTFSGQAAPNRFGISWNRDSAGSIESGTPVIQAEAGTILSVDFRGKITFTSNAHIRVAFGVSSNDFLQINSDTAKLTMGADDDSPITAFTYNASNGNNAVPNPFSFELDVLAGQVLDFSLQTSSDQYSELLGGRTTATGWSNHQEGYLTIEALPTPSATGLLGLGGLVAARRRRTR